MAGPTLTCTGKNAAALVQIAPRWGRTNIRVTRGHLVHLSGNRVIISSSLHLTLQRAALKKAGCKRLYEEKVSGAKRQRPELNRMLDQLRAGDVLVVSRLDRLARSTRDLLEIAELLKEAEAGLRSLHEPWADTTSPAGRMVLTIFAGMAEFERDLINERTSSGRIQAKARGVRFGRPPKLTGEQIKLAHRLIGEGTSVPEASRILKVHRTTLYRTMGAGKPVSSPRAR